MSAEFSAINDSVGDKRRESILNPVDVLFVNGIAIPAMDPAPVAVDQVKSSIHEI